MLRGQCGASVECPERRCASHISHPCAMSNISMRSSITALTEFCVGDTKHAREVTKHNPKRERRCHRSKLSDPAGRRNARQQRARLPTHLIFAHKPIHQNMPNQFHSDRANCQMETDPARNPSSVNHLIGPRPC